MLRIGACFLVVAVAACASPSARTSQFQFGTSTTLATTGNLRLVTERQREDLPPIVCSEPSPDYAVAFGTDASFKLGLTPPEGRGTTVDANGRVATTEEVTKLDGRDKAVLALRDGLAAACQAYANGVIGHSAYALILSQYGTLLVELAGKSDPAAVVNVAGNGAPTINIPAAPARPSASHAALLVACISEHDGTRAINGQGPGRENRLLSLGFCRQVLSRTAGRIGPGKS